MKNMFGGAVRRRLARITHGIPWAVSLPSNETTFLSYDTFERQNLKSYYRNAQFVMGVTNGFGSNSFMVAILPKKSHFHVWYGDPKQ